MQRLEVSGVVRPIYGSLGVKRLTNNYCYYCDLDANRCRYRDKMKIRRGNVCHSQGKINA